MKANRLNRDHKEYGDDKFKLVQQINSDINGADIYNYLFSELGVGSGTIFIERRNRKYYIEIKCEKSGLNTLIKEIGIEDLLMRLSVYFLFFSSIDAKYCHNENKKAFSLNRRSIFLKIFLFFSLGSIAGSLILFIEFFIGNGGVGVFFTNNKTAYIIASISLFSFAGYFINQFSLMIKIQEPLYINTAYLIGITFAFFFGSILLGNNILFAVIAATILGFLYILQIINDDDNDTRTLNKYNRYK